MTIKRQLLISLFLIFGLLIPLSGQSFDSSLYQDNAIPGEVPEMSNGATPGAGKRRSESLKRFLENKYFGKVMYYPSEITQLNERGTVTGVFKEDGDFYFVMYNSRIKKGEKKRIIFTHDFRSQLAQKESPSFHQPKDSSQLFHLDSLKNMNAMIAPLLDSSGSGTSQSLSPTQLTNNRSGVNMLENMQGEEIFLFNGEEDPLLEEAVVYQRGMYLRNGKRLKVIFEK